MTGTAANRIQFNRKLSTAERKKKKGNYMEITTGCGDARKTATFAEDVTFSDVRAIIQEFSICFTFVGAALKGRRNHIQQDTILKNFNVIVKTTRQL